nr:unnamed protein product [Callosobruchus analis]
MLLITFVNTNHMSDRPDRTTPHCMRITETNTDLEVNQEVEGQEVAVVGHRNREAVLEEEVEAKDEEKRESPRKERSKSVDSSKFMTPKQLSQQRSERRERSKSWSLPREGEPQRRSWSKSPGMKS